MLQFRGSVRTSELALATASIRLQTLLGRAPGAGAVEIAVQVNGKVRARITVPADLAEEALRERVLADPAVLPHLEGKTVRKVVVAKGPLVSVVVG